MRIALLSVALICSVSMTTSAPAIPIPQQPPGFVYNGGFYNASVQLEMFVDIQCGDSGYAWGVLKQVATHYWRDRLRLTVHFFSLPYLRNSFLLTQVRQ